MHSKDLIKINLEMSMNMTLELIEDMSDAPLTFPTSKGGNHPLWILGHLAYAEGALIQGIMLGESNPLAHWKEHFDMGTDPVADLDAYPPFSELLAQCHEARKRTLSLLESFSEDDLDRPSKAIPPQYESFFGTYRKCLLMVSNHWWMHRGQVADARLEAGRKRLGP